MEGEGLDTFIERTNHLRASIDQALDRYSDYPQECPQPLRDAIRHSLLAPGKRLRPLLVLMAARACGQHDEQAAMPAACAVEMIHTYSLIHDDLPAMDDDDLRRGLPTCHRVYGEALAILAGDALLAQAFEVLARDLATPIVAIRCVQELATAAGAIALVGGQADDLQSEFRGGSMEQLESIHHRKTGALLSVSLRLGGISSQASDEQLAALGIYGRKLGLAFQIVDDLLDYSGDVVQVGKRTGKDSARGKLTFPSLLGVEESRRRAELLVDEAIKATNLFGNRAGDLHSLARYVLERKH